MRKDVRISLVGKLDKDSDYQYVNSDGGDYVDALNMEFTEGDVYTFTNAKGNKQIFRFGSIEKQNQKIRVYWDSINKPTEISAILFNVNDYAIGIGIRYITGGLPEFKEAIREIFTGFAYPAIVTDYADKPYLDVEIGVLYSDWKIEAKGFTYDIIQEAFASYDGKLLPIGSKDYLGNIFYTLTTQKEPKSKLIQGVKNVVPNANAEAVVTIPFHGLKDYQTISINAVVGCTGVNGIWVVKVIDNNNVILLGSFVSGIYESGGEVFKNVRGFGCIGVVSPDPSKDTYTFTKLISSKAFDFYYQHKIHNLEVDYDGTTYSLYFTDNNSLPKAFYYKGDFVENGAIKALNPNGRYSLLTLREEIKLFSSIANASIEFVNQVQSGGNLTAGNKRYSARFISESGNATDLLLATNPIPVFSSDINNDAQQIYGNNSDVVTTKRNILHVSNIPAGVFKYVELICFNYSGNELAEVAVDAIIVRREKLLESQTEITLEHSGNEIGIVNFDASEAEKIQPYITKVADLVKIQNRLVLGCTNSEREIDISEWVRTFRYSIKRYPLFGGYGAETRHEFYDPTNVNKYVGYQLFEWYRFFVVAETKSGHLTQSFFCLDVRFVSKQDYLDKNGQFYFKEFESSNGSDRRDMDGDELDNYDLMADNRTFYQFYIQLKNIDWNFQINGVPVKELFSSIKIFRAERVDEVIASGAIALSQRRYFSPDVKQFYYFDNTLVSGTFDPISNNETYDSIGNGFINRKLGSFYAPDLLFSEGSYTFVQGEKLLVLGQFNLDNSLTNFSGFLRTLKIYKSSDNNVDSPNVYDIVDAKFVKQGETIKSNGIEFRKTYQIEGSSIEYNGNIQSSVVLWLYDEVTKLGNGADYGFYSCLIFRKKTDKYGKISSPQQNVYTNSIINNSIEVADIFGGDVFTQQTWLKHHKDTTHILMPVIAYGAGGVNIISQNRINTNLRVWDKADTSQLIYPLSTKDWVAWLKSELLDTIKQNSAYKIISRIQSLAVFDKDYDDENKFLSRKWYSELKPNGSKLDYFRVFLPFSFQDNPLGQGAVTRVLNVNNELFTLQERGFTREYFNNRGKLVSSDSGEVLMGDGSVLSRTGTNLTQFGSKAPGSVVIGKSQSGKDLVFFISSDFSQVLRFGDDGLVSISLRNKMRTFFNKNLKWADASENAVSSVWDNDNKQAIFTIKTWRKVDEWKSAVIYHKGDVVHYGFYEQGVPIFWKLKSELSKGQAPNDLDWMPIPTVDNQYYNVYTPVWSEIKSGFSHFYSFLPNHYTQWNGRVLSYFPDEKDANADTAWLHGELETTTFYGKDYSSSVSMVCNFSKELNKKFFALMINGRTKPERVEISTLFRNEEDEEIIKKTFLTSDDFETRESFHYAPIKLEVDENGDNDMDGNQMEGIWAKVEIIYPKNKKSSITSIVIPIRTSSRNFAN